MPKYWANICTRARWLPDDASGIWAPMSICVYYVQISQHFHGAPTLCPELDRVSSEWLATAMHIFAFSLATAEQQMGREGSRVEKREFWRFLSACILFQLIGKVVSFTVLFIESLTSVPSVDSPGDTNRTMQMGNMGTWKGEVKHREPLDIWLAEIYSLMF